MPYGRHSILTGESVALRVVFRNDAGDLIDTDSLPQVYIYDSSVDSDTRAAEIIAGTYASAVGGPYTPTLISTGFYELNYSVPSGGTEGTWYDVWVATLDGVDVTDNLSFQVDIGAELEEQILQTNDLILVILDSSITDTDGTRTFGEDVQLSFTTVLNPLYASTDLVRMECGNWINYIPETTLAMMIHFSSLEANFILAATPYSSERLAFARTKFVVFDAALRCLTLPGGSLGEQGSGGSDGGKKRLGDLDIDKSGKRTNTVAITASGVDIRTIDDLQAQRDEWLRILNAGGNIVPGQGFSPAYAVRGLHDPNRRNAGRAWLNPRDHAYLQPGANEKSKKSGYSYGRFRFGNKKRR